MTSHIKEGTISLSDKSIQPRENKDFDDTPVRRIKMKTGDVIRMTFLSDDVVARLRHYMQGVGYRRCTQYTGFCPACIAADRKSEFHKKNLKFASESFGANVYVYETVETSDDPVAPLEGLPGDITLFVFGSEKFASLRQIKSMHKSLVGLDLQVTCTDGNFQKMTITAYPREMSFSADPEAQAMMLKKLEKDGYPLEKMIAKEVSPSQLVKDFSLDQRLLELPEAGMAKEETVQDIASRPAIAKKALESLEANAATISPAPAKAAPKQDVYTSANDLLDEL